MVVVVVVVEVVDVFVFCFSRLMNDHWLKFMPLAYGFLRSPLSR